MTSYYTIVVLHLRCLQNIVVNSSSTIIITIARDVDFSFQSNTYVKFEIIGSQGLFIFVFPFSYQLIIKHSLITDRRH